MYAARFTVDAAGWPALEAELEALGALAITCADGDAPLFDEPGTASSEQWARFAVEALFDEAVAADAVRALLAPRAVSIAAVAEDAWAERWKAHWQPQIFAGGLCVHPSWCAPAPGARHLIELDPGQAFGTGTHPTTALCLDWLATQAPLTGQSVIDYGCGSAILALAAERFGAAHVQAVDIDRAALAVAADNVARNAAGAVVSVGAPDTLAAGSADLLIANILLEPLLSLADRFAALLRPHGRILLSGVLATQVERLQAGYPGAFAFDPVMTREEWAALAGRRVPATV